MSGGRWVCVVKSIVQTFNGALNIPVDRERVDAVVVEAATAIEAARDAVRRSSVVALRRGVEVEVFAVGNAAGRWRGRYSKPTASLGEPDHVVFMAVSFDP